MCKFPKVIVDLPNTIGLADIAKGFAIAKRVTEEMQTCGVSHEDIGQYLHEAFGGDHHHLIQVTAAWVQIR